MTIGAVLFDLDGTLVDNMGAHWQAWQQTAARLGIELTEEVFRRDLAGRKNDEIFPALLARPIAAAELQTLAETKEALYRDIYRPQVRPLAGADLLLSRLAARGIVCAVASAAPKANRELVLGALGYQARFAAVIGAEHVKHGKPAPDLFLAAAAAVGVEPARCLVFEDAVLGVQAARAAGMEAAAVTTTTAADVLLRAGARWTSADFTDLDPTLIELLFGEPAIA